MDTQTQSSPQIPHFRRSCLTISGIYVFLAGTMLLRGPMEAMKEYQVPAETLASPHYADAMLWVFWHMTVLGLIIGCVGYFATELRLQRAFSRLMLSVGCVYTSLDIHTADWALGNGLYKGNGSLGPVVVGVFALILWARLSFIKAR